MDKYFYKRFLNGNFDMLISYSILPNFQADDVYTYEEITEEEFNAISAELEAAAMAAEVETKEPIM